MLSTLYSIPNAGLIAITIFIPFTLYSGGQLSCTRLLHEDALCWNISISSKSCIKCFFSNWINLALLNLPLILTIFLEQSLFLHHQSIKDVPAKNIYCYHNLSAVVSSGNTQVNVLVPLLKSRDIVKFLFLTYIYLIPFSYLSPVSTDCIYTVLGTGVDLTTTMLLYSLTNRF